MMKITGATEIYGIVGHPVEHSLSPLIQNAAFQGLGLDGCYLAFDVKPRDLKKAVQGLAALGVKGLNVTIPHKEAAIALLDKVTSDAARIGAVNTIVIRQGRLIGYNTDGPGFVQAFNEEAGVPLTGKRVLLLGAGGAARSVAYHLAREGVKRVVIINRTLPRAKRLVRDFEMRFEKVDWVAKVLSSRIWPLIFRDGMDVIINATPIGMRPVDPVLIPARYLTKDQVVCDLIYRPVKTRLLEEAEAAGAKTVNGLGMLLHQGVLAFELWTGEKPPIVLLRDAMENWLHSFSHS